MPKKRSYARIARLYDLLDLPFEYARYRPIRKILFEGVSGAILDAGVGTGRNMPFYPRAGDVVGIDISAQMLARAVKRKTRLGVRAELRNMDVMATNFPGRHFDYVIATFLFCVLDDEDQLPALRELERICKLDGEIRIIEYTFSHNPLKRFMMRLWAPWVRLMYGASFGRDTESYVEDADLQLVEKLFVYQDIIKLLVLRPR